MPFALSFSHLLAWNAATKRCENQRLQRGGTASPGPRSQSPRSPGLETAEMGSLTLLEARSPGSGSQRLPGTLLAPGGGRPALPFLGLRLRHPGLCFPHHKASSPGLPGSPGLKRTPAILGRTHPAGPCLNLITSATPPPLCFFQ